MSQSLTCAVCNEVFRFDGTDDMTKDESWARLASHMEREHRDYYRSLKSWVNSPFNFEMTKTTGTQMACMEHSCANCGYSAFDNIPSISVCPDCGSSNVISFFDEQFHPASPDESEFAAQDLDWEIEFTPWNDDEEGDVN